MATTTRSKKAITPLIPPALRRLDDSVVTSSVAAPKKSDIPVVYVEGDTMARYNAAAAAAKDAEVVLESLRPLIKQEALEYIFKSNCRKGLDVPLTSVKLQDVEIDEEKPEGDPTRTTLGELTRVSFTSKYGSSDPVAVETAFAGMPGRNVNDYVAETLFATFDSSVFLDADGNFSKKVYDKFRTAIDRVAAELGLKNEDGSVKTPLNTKRVLMVKPTFHDDRYKDFSVEENFTLAKVLPNTVQVVPVRTA